MDSAKDWDADFFTGFVDFEASGVIVELGHVTSVIKSHSVRAGSPSIRRVASKAITSASALECETAPCFLQTHVIGTNVLGPKRHIRPPDVDLLSWRSPANEASQNNPREH